MTTRLHTTVMGHRIEYTPTPRVEAFLRRIEKMVSDPSATEREVVGLAFSRENPILDQGMFPERGAVTREVLADPSYHVLSDLIFRKRLADDRVDVEKLAARYSLSVAEAAKELGVHESAVRQAIAAKRLASWVKDGRHFIDPRALATFEVGTRGPKAKSSALEIVMGHAKGARLKVKADVPIEGTERVGGNVVKARLEKWRRLLVMTVGEGGSKRLFVLEPARDVDEITFGPFSVRGGFVVREKINNAADAEKVWGDAASIG